MDGILGPVLAAGTPQIKRLHNPISLWDITSFRLTVVFRM